MRLLGTLVLTALIAPFVAAFGAAIAGLLIPVGPVMLTIIAALSIFGTWGVVYEKLIGTNND